MDGQNVWKGADGKRYNNILIVWGEFPARPEVRVPVLDDEGKPHEKMWIPLPYATHSETSGEKKLVRVERVRDRRGRWVSLRGEVAKFLQFFHESSDSRRWPIVEPRSRPSSRVSASPEP